MYQYDEYLCLVTQETAAYCQMRTHHVHFQNSPTLSLANNQIARKPRFLAA